MGSRSVNTHQHVTLAVTWEFRSHLSVLRGLKGHHKLPTALTLVSARRFPSQAPTHITTTHRRHVKGTRVGPRIRRTFSYLWWLRYGAVHSLSPIIKSFKESRTPAHTLSCVHFKGLVLICSIRFLFFHKYSRRFSPSLVVCKRRVINH